MVDRSDDYWDMPHLVPLTLSSFPDLAQTPATLQAYTGTNCSKKGPHKKQPYEAAAAAPHRAPPKERSTSPGMTMPPRRICANRCTWLYLGLRLTCVYVCVYAGEAVLPEPRAPLVVEWFNPGASEPNDQEVLLLFYALNPLA